MQRVVVAEKLKGEFQRIPIELIKSGGSREIFEDIEELAATVREHGLLEPILVRKLEKGYGFRVVCGERRLRACRKAELQTVPAIILDEKVTKEEILEFQLIENLQRSDLKPFEEIKLVKQLKDRFQLSNAEIAAKIGVSESTIGDYLSIAQALPEKIIRMITRTKGGRASPHELTLSKAVILARANLPPGRLKEMVELIRKKGVTRQLLAKNLAAGHKQKIRRVVAGRTFWNELTKSLKQFKGYWSEYCQLKEWETVSEFHLELKVVLRKDLGETKV